jgi:hypothetical protein
MLALLLPPLLLLTSACSASKPGQTSLAKANSYRHSIPAGELGGPFTTASVGSAEHVLAQSGIATVADETSKSPIVAVTGPLRMTFTETQVRSMALQAADGGGILGSALDATATVPTGDPPLSYLLAAWVSKLDTPGATEMRTVMGTQDWRDAPTVAFPSIALPLFVSDVIAASGAAATTSEDRGGSAIVLTGVADAPCSTVATFIQGVLNTVFNGLMLGGLPGTSVPSKIGNFFVTLWDAAVALAQFVVQGLISAITAAGVGAIQTVAATVAVVAQIVAYLTPWTVKITPPVQSVNAGDTGTVSANVDTGLGAASYAAAVTDCANGATLPPLTGADLPAVWSLTDAISPTGPTTVTLDATGSSTITFCAASCAGTTTGTSSPCSAGAGQDGAPTGLGFVSISVNRPGIDGLQQLVNGMLTTGLGAAGSIAGPIVTSLLSPIVDSIQAQLDGLTQEVVGTGLVIVNNVPSPTEVANPGGCTPCLVGTWKTTNISIPATHANGGANVTWTMTAAGHLVTDWTGSSPIVSRYPEYTVSSVFTGTATFSWTLPSDASATSGTTIQRELSGAVNVVTTDTLTNPPTVTRTTSPVSGEAAPGTWTCQGNTMTASSSGSEEVITLTRIA